MYVDYADRLFEKLKSANREEARTIVTDDFSVSEGYSPISLGPEKSLDYVRQVIILSRRTDGVEPQIIRVCYGKMKGKGRMNRQEIEIDIELNIGMEKPKISLLAMLDHGSFKIFGCDFSVFRVDPNRVCVNNPRYV